MRKFIGNYVLTCECTRAKLLQTKPHGLLQPLSIPECPWSDLSTDFIVELPPSGGFNAISVWVCHLTKMAHFAPCTTSVTSEGLALISEITSLGSMAFLQVLFLTVGHSLSLNSGVHFVRL